MSDLQFPGLYIGEAADLRPALPSLVRCGYYALVMAADVSESGTKYGRQYYDYNCGTLICRYPDAAYAGLPASCLWAVAFHPDLFEGCVQEKRAEEYTFFSYAPAEALHVSCEERRILTSCFDDLRRELRHGADRYTRAILTRHIIRLLDYTTRFYERQFITRNTANEALVWEYEAFADRYLADGKWAIRGPAYRRTLRGTAPVVGSLFRRPSRTGTRAHASLPHATQAYRDRETEIAPVTGTALPDRTRTRIPFGAIFRLSLQENDRTFPRRV